MKLIIKKNIENIKPIVKKISIDSSEYLDNTIEYQIYENDILLIEFSDLQQLYIVLDLHNKYRGINSETLVELNEDDLQLIKETTITVDPRPYKSYVAILVQSGTTAPSATVLENTLTVPFTYVRYGPGTYGLESTGAFPLNKTFVSIPNKTNNVTLVTNIQHFDNNNILLRTLNGSILSDDMFYRTAIEIRVYN